MGRRQHSYYIVQLITLFVITAGLHAARAQSPAADAGGQCRAEANAQAARVRKDIRNCGCTDEDKEKRTRELSQALARDLKACDQLSTRQSDTENAMPEEAADLVAMLGRVSENLHLPKGPALDRARATLNCQYFFRELGRQLSIAKKPSWENDFPDMDADTIAARIAKSVRGNEHKWREVRIEDVQALANQGRIVIGGQEQVDGHGHLAIAFPTPLRLNPALYDGSGPFVRDGNEHRPHQKTYPSTYGAVKASEAFYLSKTKWYVWVPSSP